MTNVMTKSFTEEQYLKAFNASDTVKDKVREWMRESDDAFAQEQLDHYRNAVSFDVDGWNNVCACPKVSPENARVLLDAFRNCPFGYKDACEELLTKLEHYCDGIDRITYDLPGHFYDAIERVMEAICNPIANDIEDCFHAWLYYDEPTLKSYYLDFAENILEELAPMGTTSMEITEKGSVLFHVSYTLEV